MFADAIELVDGFTRPIFTIKRRYADNMIVASASTLFFVNDDGFAVTSKRVASLLAGTKQINARYVAFRAERNGMPLDAENGIEAMHRLHEKYGITGDAMVQIKNMFINCVEPLGSFTTIPHPRYDLAILKLNGFKKTTYHGHAVFIKDASRLRQGDYLCRLGFPFAEFTNFRYNERNDDIEWTQEGIRYTPKFPSDGMITRFVGGEEGVIGIELSTPGLEGQSGGPLFDKDGIVCGMQFGTIGRFLGMNNAEREELIGDKPVRVRDEAFIHLGQALHANIIKDFLRKNDVTFYEE